MKYRENCYYYLTPYQKDIFHNNYGECFFPFCYSLYEHEPRERNPRHFAFALCYCWSLDILTDIASVHHWCLTLGMHVCVCMCRTCTHFCKTHQQTIVRAAIFRVDIFASRPKLHYERLPSLLLIFRGVNVLKIKNKILWSVELIYSYFHLVKLNGLFFSLLLIIALCNCIIWLKWNEIKGNSCVWNN